MRKFIDRHSWTIAVMVGCILIVGGIFGVATSPDRPMRGDNNLLAISSSTPAVKVSFPVDLTGIWESDDQKMVATIENQTIAIDFLGTTGETNYWNGTFEYPMSGLSVIASKRIDDEFMLSGADSKQFMYNDGVISFEVTALGSTATITLTKR